jgi:hypothetical protein
MPLTRWWTAALVAGAVVAGCTASPMGIAGTLPPGLWGGDQVNLIVTPDSARAEFVCASGWLDTPIAVDSAGVFAVDGQYRFEAGPVGLPVPARWLGRVTPLLAPSEITLRVVVLNPGFPPDTLGPFQLVAGKRQTTGLCA